MQKANQIVLFTNDNETDSLLIKTLKAHYPTLTITNNVDSLVSHLAEPTPKVVLVSAEKFQDTLTIFYHALNRVSDANLCDHFFVSLVSRHDEAEAYDAYRSGIVDDYLVARPLYEKHRPIVICEHLLIELGVAKEEKPGLEHIYKEQKYAEEVRKFVAKGLERKEQMKLALENSVNRIEKSLNNAAEKIQKNQTATLDLTRLKETLAQIKSDEIRPELLKLQSKALSLLNIIITDSEDILDPIEEDDELPDIPKAPAFNHFQEQQAMMSAEGIVIPKIAEKTKILLIEDDPISIHLTSEIIALFDTELDTAFTGRRALACLKNKDYDLILLDLNLPDTSGIFILDQLGKSGRNQKAVTIVLTGNRQKKVAIQCINLGAKNYIVKPLRRDNLVSLCEKFQIPLRKVHT